MIQHLFCHSRSCFTQQPTPYHTYYTSTFNPFNRRYPSSLIVKPTVRELAIIILRFVYFWRLFVLSLQASCPSRPLHFLTSLIPGLGQATAFPTLLKFFAQFLVSRFVLRRRCYVRRRITCTPGWIRWLSGGLRIGISWAWVWRVRILLACILRIPPWCAPIRVRRLRLLLVLGRIRMRVRLWVRLRVWLLVLSPLLMPLLILLLLPLPFLVLLTVLLLFLLVLRPRCAPRFADLRRVRENYSHIVAANVRTNIHVGFLLAPG